MVKTVRWFTFVLLIMSSCQHLVAKVHFGLSFGFPFQPVYTPSVYVTPCRPTVGIGFNIPLPSSTPAFLDDRGSRHWKIYNESDTPVKVSNKSGASIVVKPGSYGRLSHKNSYKFTVTAQGQRIKSASKHHTLIVDFDEFEELNVFAA